MNSPAGYFKIIAFINKKGKSSIMQYAYVPHLWEQNGKFFWPNTDLTRERENPNSVPQDKWFQYKGVVKKDNIIGLAEATLWEEQFLDCPNTDAEET